MLTTLALCWRIERRDGVAIGLTGHDRDLALDGLTYRAAPGMTPAAIRQSDGFDGEFMDVAGALSSAAISDGDLRAGRWDGARVIVFALDWAAPASPIPLGEGTIGAVETEGARYLAELRPLTAQLDRACVEETSPDCRAVLGDRRCRVPLAPLRRIARLVAVTGAGVRVDAAEPFANAYGQGRLRWLSGANSGLDADIAGADGDLLMLRLPPPAPAAAGDLVELTQGCDKLFATCRDRFGNAANFRGEPFLPGIDLLTRYPDG